ncbi:hypothetical protein MHYP_G00016260 [Metynnis hypsauchen]
MIVRPRSLLLGLLVILYLQSCAVGSNVKPPKERCFSFYPKPIPVDAITEYEKMSHHCTRAGVVFTTKKGYRVCVDPSVWWVKRATDIINRRIAES